MQSKYPSKTFCILPWVHLSTRPDGSMRVCCTANASSVGPTNDKQHGGMVGVLKTDEGKPSIKSREFVPDRLYGKGYLRRASVAEAMRLQGFPSSFVPHESDRIAYEQAGNAVNAKVIREIADNLLRYIL